MTNVEFRIWKVRAMRQLIRGVAACLVATCLLGASSSAQRRERQLMPVDDAVKQPEFFTFRARLQSAVARRDIEAIVSMSSSGIRQSFGGDGGAASWRRALAAANSPIFGDLAEALALGGTFTSADQFVAPYVYSTWPDDVDAFSHVAIVGDRVAVRAEASARSALVTTLSYALVPVGPAGEKDGMSEVQLADGRRGFVATRFLRSSVGHRALFTRANGQWLLAAFVAGD